jgi:hypothetical protein
MERMTQYFTQSRILFLYCSIIAAYAVAWLPEHIFVALCREDHYVENIGALLFLAASLCFFRAYLLSDYEMVGEEKFITRQNSVYLLLGCLLAICFGEEISWGQRIIGLQTPELMMQVNVQQEFNIHNLSWFHAKNPDGSHKSFWALMLNMNRLFSLFWLTFCLLLPALALFSQKVRSLAMRTRLPLAPLWIGLLFLMNFVVFRIMHKLFASSSDQMLASLDEVKESLYALIFFILAVYELLRVSGANNRIRQADQV